MEHWAGRWNKQKTPPVLPTPRASKSGLLTRNNPIQQLYCTTSGQACQSVPMEVYFYGIANEYSGLAAEPEPLAD